MGIISKIRGWFKSKEEPISDRMQYLVAYKSEVDYFDRVKLAKKMKDASVVLRSTDDEWHSINWSRVSEPVKAQCIELAKQDIATQIESIK
jgi:hypothetical protein